MIFEQFILESLGHASYMLGSERTGQALVLDVRRDVDVYFAAARRHGVRIAYAVDTHQHNDYLTGICELPARGEVTLLASARAELQYPTRPLHDGDRLELGEIAVEVVHTPGHTPEHISLLVTDRARGEEPALLLSGGALLVNDVGRPDLLAGHESTVQLAAASRQTLLGKILALPDHVEVYPTHVAGSLCAANIGGRYSTTIGYERRLNRLLACLVSEEDFVRECLRLETLPAVPPYWRRMRSLNEKGPPLLGTLREPPAVSVGEFARLRDEGAVVLDCRSPEAFGGGHIPGALNVGVGGQFPTWAGTVLDVGVPIMLVVEDARDLWDICWSLVRIGYDVPAGWLAGGMFAWRVEGKPLATMPQWSIHELRCALEGSSELLLLDVRQLQEWRAGHMALACHIAGAELPDRIDEIPRHRPVAVICSSGYRSSVAASLLARRGHTSVVNVLGGMTAWQRTGFPTVSEREREK